VNFINSTTIDDIDLSAMDFPVELQDIFTERPGKAWMSNTKTYTAVSRDRAQAVVRTDTHEVLGVHGGRYALRSFNDNAGRMIEALKESDIDLADVTGKIEVFEGGRKLKAELILPKHAIEPAIGDITQLRFKMWDSYDGTFASQHILEGYRLWCLNGCTSRNFALKAHQKHTKQITGDFQMEAAVNKMNVAMLAFHEREDEFRRWIAQPVQREEVQDMYTRTLALSPRPSKPDNVSDKVLDNLMQLFDGEQRNVWGAYNAATAWASHPETKGKAYNVERTREGKVSSMLRGKHWLELERADNDIVTAA